MLIHEKFWVLEWEWIVAIWRFAGVRSLKGSEWDDEGLDVLDGPQDTQAAYMCILTIHMVGNDDDLDNVCMNRFAEESTKVSGDYYPSS